MWHQDFENVLQHQQANNELVALTAVAASSAQSDHVGAGGHLSTSKAASSQQDFTTSTSEQSSSYFYNEVTSSPGNYELDLSIHSTSSNTSKRMNFC